MNFASILEGKIRKEIESSMNSRPSPSINVDNFDTDPAHLAFILSQVSPLKSVKVASKSGYPRTQPKPITPHQLTEAQQKARNTFAKWGLELSPAFTRHELKKGFWSLAKRLHPDHSGLSGQEFMELRAAYQTLSPACRS